MSNSESDLSEIRTNFGGELEKARKTQNYTIEDISEHIKVPVHVLTAIEKNDIDALPMPTYTQGYIRAYAKFLEISEDNILQMYNRAVPHSPAAELKPRSKLKNGASSQSPLVKMVTIILILAGVTTLIYGSYQYYQGKAVDMEAVLESKETPFTGNSLDSPAEMPVEIRQHASMSEEGELILDEPADSLPAVDEDDTASPAVAAEDLQPVAKNDVVEIYAEKGAWLEVYDASNSRLFYNMVAEGKTEVLSGKAPFRISLGNAGNTRIMVNDIEIDMSKYIRSNNTATFTVATEGQQVVFY